MFTKARHANRSERPICLREGAGCLIAATALVVSAVAGAQSDRSLGTLEEIVVTGTKRDAAAQDVPIAISAVTADTLSRSQFNDVRALRQLAPGLVLSNSPGFNSTGGGMRGTGTNLILVTQDAPVSFLVDDFALSHISSQFINMFDVEQIEVYRGPQGTLFGKNATGGVISVTSKKPVLGELSAETDLALGQYSSSGGANYGSVKGALNVPLGDTLALRVAAIFDYDDGYYRDSKFTATFPENVPLWNALGIPAGTPLPPEINPNVTGTGDHLGGKEVLAVKTKLLWKPTDDVSAYLIYEYLRDRSDSPPSVNESLETDLFSQLGFPGIGPGDNPYNTLLDHNDDILDMNKGHRVDTDGLYLNLDWDLGHGLVKSITGWRQEKQKFPSAYTGEAFLNLHDAARNLERETFQQEFRYVSQFDGPFNFVAGANYFRDELEFVTFFSLGFLSLLPTPDPTTGTFITPEGFISLDTRELSDYQMHGAEQKRDEYGLYLDGTYEIDERWSVTAGVRFTSDKKEFFRYVEGGALCNQFTEAADQVIVNGECRDVRSNRISRVGLTSDQWNGSAMPFSQFGTVLNTDKTWEETTYRLVLSYKPVVDQMIYLSYATGFLSGGFSEGCYTVSRCPYDPETVKNLELGYKSDLLDSTLRLNAAVFYTTYEDLQRAASAPVTTAAGDDAQEAITINTGESELWGLDLEATWVPLTNLRLVAALNLLDHQYTKGILPDLVGGGTGVDLRQFDIPYSPELKASLSAQYEIPLSAASVILSGSVNYQEEAETEVFNRRNTQMEERTLVDLGVTYQRDRWALTAFVANATDEEYRVAALPVAGLWTFTNYGAPRSFGLKMRYSFFD